MVFHKNNDDDNHIILINKCFNVIRHICDNRNYVIAFYVIIFETFFNIVINIYKNILLIIQKDFCEIISTLFKYMNHIKKIEFDEDLVLVVTSLITIGEKVPQEAINFFKYTPKYLKKNKGLMLDLFELLNAYVIYGSEMFENDIENIKTLCNLIKISITDYFGYDKSAYLGYNLLSIFLQV